MKIRGYSDEIKLEPFKEEHFSGTTEVWTKRMLGRYAD